MQCIRSASNRAKLILFPSILLVFVFSGPVAASAAFPSIKVMVLPVSINASKDLGYLSMQISEVLVKQLKQDGADVVQAAEDENKGISRREISVDQIRQIARRSCNQR